jgi:CMP-N-acetylneuraminic acid synthetase
VSPENKLKIVAMIPARMGSTRLALKNLALVGGKPLISYAVGAARDAGVFDRVVINSEGVVFKEIAKRCGVEFYHRPPEYASSTAKSDTVVYDFIKNNPCDIVVWVNPISPLQTADEVRRVVEYFIDEGLDSLITVKNEQVHCVFEGRPVNFSLEGMFAQTQELVPVQPFVYSIMMWKSKTFIESFEKDGYAVLCGKVGYYAVSRESAIIIKTEEDIMFADYVMRARQSTGGFNLEYDKLAEEFLRKDSL